MNFLSLTLTNGSLDMTAVNTIQVDPPTGDTSTWCGHGQHQQGQLCNRVSNIDYNSVLETSTRVPETEAEAARRQNYLSFLTYMKYMENMPIEVIKVVTVAFYIIGLFANILLLFYIVKFKRYRSPTFAIIFSLAIADSGTCVGAALFSAFAMYRLVGPPCMCIVAVFITVIPYTTSVCHMVGFSIMRFYQLVYPLKARARITISLIAKLSVCAWLLNIATIPYTKTYFHAITYKYKGNDFAICGFEENNYQLFIETTYLLVPSVLIAIFHVAKHCAVKRQAQKTMSESTDHEEKHRQSTDARAVTIVIVMFCITSWPQLVHFYLHFVFRMPPTMLHDLIGVICITMEYGNSIFNPFIYVFCASSIRRDIINMIIGR